MHFCLFRRCGKSFIRSYSIFEVNIKMQNILKNKQCWKVKIPNYGRTALICNSRYSSWFQARVLALTTEDLVVVGGIVQSSTYLDIFSPFFSLPRETTYRAVNNLCNILIRGPLSSQHYLLTSMALYHACKHFLWLKGERFLLLNIAIMQFLTKPCERGPI